MQFMLLIIEPPHQRSTRTEAEGQAVYDRMVKFSEALQARGVLRGVESLQSHAQATRVQVREQRAQVTDGPFAEAKEMIGGYFLVDVPSRAAAVALAAECPAAAWCTVEVRGFGPCYDDGAG